VVTLHGDVDWPFQLDAALKDLQRLGAIRELHSDVVVRPPVKPERVQEKIRDAFAQLAPLDAERIFATAEGSEVTLAGEVTSWHEKGLAESVAWSVPGVSKVINNILVI
jgi:osmotically-inducible protein OsmY